MKNIKSNNTNKFNVMFRIMRTPKRIKKEKKNDKTNTI